ncbi:sugar phosphate isomerase/epimerase [Aquimarina sp. AU119]|uniref:sugar phosphate isomerase/epimerase family protein n=1 Tax=Aquimarina sp. AU119 TaxID=2108528 RepID=UPI000D685DA4|nr:TIM barrel protein [Aquimarina sp. AU119]
MIHFLKLVNQFKKIMMDRNNHCRRDFIKKGSLATIGGLSFTSVIGQKLVNFEPESHTPELYIFSKALQFLDYKEMSVAAKEIGADGLDLTVRPKGHVLPENVTRDLPKVTEIMQSYGLKTKLISSSVKNAEDPVNIQLLKVAAKLGYSHYRTGWFKYPKDIAIERDIEAYAIQLKGLAQLNQDIGITGAYQNHSGLYFGAPIWDLKTALKDMNPKFLGCQYDIMHASLEGAKSWELDFQLIQPHINSLVIKDFKWIENNGIWKKQYTSLGEGMINFDAYFEVLKKYKINVPISIHYEYDLGGAEHGKIPTIPKEKILKQMKKDIEFIKKGLSK